MENRKQSYKEIKLIWVGPVAWGHKGLKPHPLDPKGPRMGEIKKIIKVGGVYIVNGDHPIHGPRSLLYIGQTKDFEGRIVKQHQRWLSEEWRLELCLTEIEEHEAREDVEKLLIYAHSPAYNSKNISSIKLKNNPLRYCECW